MTNRQDDKASPERPQEIAALLATEPLHKQFSRAFGRIANMMYAHPVRLQDINRIKLPKAADGTRYFADRNAKGNWNVIARTGELRGAAPHTLQDTVIGLDLDIHAALDVLAEKHPTGIKENNGSTSHPAYIAECIGHSFAPVKSDAHVQASVQKPRKNGGFEL